MKCQVTTLVLLVIAIAISTALDFANPSRAGQIVKECMEELKKKTGKSMQDIRKEDMSSKQAQLSEGRKIFTGCIAVMGGWVNEENTKVNVTVCLQRTAMFCKILANTCEGMVAAADACCKRDFQEAIGETGGVGSAVMQCVDQLMPKNAVVAMKTPTE